MYVPSETRGPRTALSYAAPLGTAGSTELAELAELAAGALQVPLAVVSLFDENGDWLTSTHGTGADMLPDHDAWCALALQGDALLEIPDLRQDERFLANASTCGMRFLAAGPLCASSGRRIGVLGVFDDMPRRFDEGGRRTLVLLAKQIVARLEARPEDADRRQSETLAEEAQEARNFVDVVSHDLRAPLVNVLGFADELKRSAEELRAIMGAHRPDCPLDLARRLEEVIEEHIGPSLGFLRSSAARMNEQVEALLELARAERYAVNREAVELDTLVRDIVTLHEIELKRAGASVCIEPLGTIESDRSILHHVFENLIDNAIKYRCERRALRIVVSMDGDEDAVVVHVRDSGRGIASDDVAAIFNMFRRVGTADATGAGVGLCHARMLVRRLGGRIWCDSVPDEGAVFHVALPRRSDAAVPADSGAGALPHAVAT